MLFPLESWIHRRLFIGKIHQCIITLNTEEYEYEFFTTNWKTGELQYLDACPITGCDVSNMNLFPDKLTDLEGKELHLATMHYPPYSILDLTGPPDGVEIRIFKEFAEMYNATWSIKTDDKQWGFVFKNGSTGEGVLGTVAAGKADFGCAAVFMWYEPHTLLEYTIPYIRSGVTCLVPRAQVLPKWLLPSLPFSIQIWIVLITSLFLSTAVMYGFHKFAHNYVGEKQKHTVGDYAVKTIGLLTSQTVSRTQFRPPYRLLLTLFHIYYFLISVYYSTGLASVITVPTYEKQINTIEDLIESDLIWGGTHDVWLFSIGGAESTQVKNILSRYHTLSFNELKRRSFRRDMAYAIERLPGGIYAIGDFITEDAIENLAVMNYDIYYEYCGLAVYKISPYLRNANQIIQQLFQSGIVKHWTSDVTSLYLSSTIQKSVNMNKNNAGSATSTPTTIKLMHLSGAFSILFIGLLSGFFVFIIEIGTDMFKKF